MAYNPNAVFLSPSSIADFDKCPQLYFLRNVYRSPTTGLKIQLINPALALGQAVHDTLEQFTNLDPTDRTPEKITAIFSSVWQNLSGEKGGFASSAEEKEHQNRALSMFDRLLAHPRLPRAVKARLPDFPKVDLGDDLILTGKLDWIEEEKDGTYHIIDFKTGQNEERDDSWQLPIYAVLAKGILRTDQVRVSYWYLDKDSDHAPKTLPDLEELVAKIKQKGQIIKLARQTSSFTCSKGPGQSCWACRDMLAIKEGKGKLVAVDTVRKQEIYILPKTTETSSDLPF